MITFAERLSTSVSICVAEKHIMYQKYFAPIEMLYNILKV